MPTTSYRHFPPGLQRDGRHYSPVYQPTGSLPRRRALHYRVTGIEPCTPLKPRPLVLNHTRITAYWYLTIRKCSRLIDSLICHESLLLPCGASVCVAGSFFPGTQLNRPHSASGRKALRGFRPHSHSCYVHHPIRAPYEPPLRSNFWLGMCTSNSPADSSEMGFFRDRAMLHEPHNAVDSLHRRIISTIIWAPSLIHFRAQKQRACCITHMALISPFVACKYHFHFLNEPECNHFRKLQVKPTKGGLGSSYCKCKRWNCEEGEPTSWTCSDLVMSDNAPIPGVVKRTFLDLVRLRRLCTSGIEVSEGGTCRGIISSALTLRDWYSRAM